MADLRPSPGTTREMVKDMIAGHERKAGTRETTLEMLHYLLMKGVAFGTKQAVI